MKKMVLSVCLNILLMVSMVFIIYTNYGGIEFHGVGYIFSIGLPFSVLFILTVLISLIFIIAIIYKNLKRKSHNLKSWIPVILFALPIFFNIIIRMIIK